MLQTKKVDYKDKEVTLEAYYAFDDASKTKKPAVLIAHDWTGKNAWVCEKAEMLAKLGYIGIAIDMYGKGIIGTTTEEKMALMQPIIQDRNKLIQRITAAFDMVKTLPEVDIRRIGVIGYCFGGLCALDLARSGADIRGVVSFHGSLASSDIPNQPIKAKILVLHGHIDPMVPPEQVANFEKEMTDANVDWQVHVYSNTKHAFTNPQANDEKLGIVYNKTADQRSWVAMKNFLAEVFQ